MRSRCSRVSSTEETFFAWRAAESSESVAFSTYSMTFGTRYRPSWVAGATAW